MEFVLEGWVEFDKKLKCFIFKKKLGSLWLKSIGNDKFFYFFSFFLLIFCCDMGI